MYAPDVAGEQDRSVRESRDEGGVHGASRSQDGGGSRYSQSCELSREIASRLQRRGGVCVGRMTTSSGSEAEFPQIKKDTLRLAGTW